MLALFSKLLCKHQWKHLDTVTYRHDYNNIPYKIIDVYVCEKCGKFKNRVYD